MKEEKLLPTPHIEAEEGEVAQTVIMPGDPLRARYIAENFLDDISQFNRVRNMFGYTGFYKGKRVSVMGSGMGMPSIGIYSYELFKFYGVESIIRVGSCGAYSEELKMLDTVMVKAAYSDSTYAQVQSGYTDHFIYPSQKLNGLIDQVAKDHKITIKEATIHSSDTFYVKEPEALRKRLVAQDILAVEMESFALFANSHLLGKKAACLLTVSDSLATGASTTSSERETAFTDMMTLGLETAIRL